MSKVVILGLSGEEGYWLVDFDNGTVTALPELEADPFGYSDEARANGATLISGIDLGVQVETQDEAFAGKYQATPAFSGKYQATPAFSGKYQATPAFSGKYQATPAFSGKYQATPAFSGRFITS